MAAASLQQTGMLLPPMRKDKERSLMQQTILEWIGDSGAGWSAKIQSLATLDTSASLARFIEFEGMFKVCESLWKNYESQRAEFLVLELNFETLKRYQDLRNTRFKAAEKQITHF